MKIYSKRYSSDYGTFQQVATVAIKFPREKNPDPEDKLYRGGAAVTASCCDTENVTLMAINEQDMIVRQTCQWLAVRPAYNVGSLKHDSKNYRRLISVSISKTLAVVGARLIT